ncbi:energy-coupling factor ABC transporter ATP-binding protein [Chloroflexota bacterium]
MEAVVNIDNLSFCYPDGQQALTNVSLTIYRGETVALIGPNGAGKSTLLLHLNDILSSGNGVVNVLGRPVDGNNRRWVRGKLGLVFQNPDDQLFSPTVFDDVAFGPLNMGYSEAEVRRHVTEALDWVGMAGYEQRSSHHLSLGEKKRVAIATVLSMDPEILVIDEPTSSLDPGSKWSLIDLLRRLPATKIVASHDLELVQALCQRAIVFDQGQVVADGATDHILADVSLLAAHGLAPSRVTKVT